MGKTDQMLAIAKVYQTVIGKVHVGQQAVVTSQAFGSEVIGDRICQRIVEIELKSGDLQTVASKPALVLRSLPDINLVSQKKA